MTTIVIIIVFICFINVVFHINSLLIILLSLEALILSIMFLLSRVVIINEINLILLCITILRIGACEARIGLSLLVLISRLYGSDLILLISICKC